jgi:hypothetical protein
VQGLYTQFLRRPADTGGLAAFSGALERSVSEQGVIALLLSSEEYFSRVANRP